MVRLWFTGSEDGWWELKVERRRHSEARAIDVGRWPMSVLMDQINDVLAKCSAIAPVVRKRRREGDGGRKKAKPP